MRAFFSRVEQGRARSARAGQFVFDEIDRLLQSLVPVAQVDLKPAVQLLRHLRANPRPGVPDKRDVYRGRILTDQQVEAVLCTDLPAALLAPLAERLVPLQVQGSR